MQALTLVTCYPFYYVGSAPQRFIVRAVRVEQQGDVPFAYQVSRLLGLGFRNKIMRPFKKWEECYETCNE